MRFVTTLVILYFLLALIADYGNMCPLLVTQDVLNKGKSDFVVDDDNYSFDDLEDDASDDDDGSGGERGGSADEEDGEEESFDSVCSICDEGGPLLWYANIYNY